MAVNGSVGMAIKHIPVVTQSDSNGSACFPDILFETNRTFKKIDGITCVTGIDIVDFEVLFGLITNKVTFIRQNLTRGTVGDPTKNDFGWKFWWHFNNRCGGFFHGLQ